LRTVQEVFRSDPIYFATITSIYNDVSRGIDLTAAMRRTGLFTNLILSLVKTGEESGTLDKVLDQAANTSSSREPSA
jgi:type II secretory pathway component PulF